MTCAAGCGARVALDGARCGACIRRQARRIRWRCATVSCRAGRGSAATPAAASDALWEHDRAYHRTEPAA